MRPYVDCSLVSWCIYRVGIENPRHRAACVDNEPNAGIGHGAQAISGTG
jgi:hypothetical protein